MAAIAHQILRADADGTEAWREQRTKGFGGSNAAALHNGRTSRFAMWREKVGLAEPEYISPELQALFDYGHSREPEIARMFTDRTGLRVRNTGTWARKDEPWMLANPDRLVGSHGILEIKTTGAFTDAAKEWRNGRVPADAWVQNNWYAHVTGRRVLWFAAEVDRQLIILGPYDVDQDLIDDLVVEATDLWELVTVGEQPAPTAPEDMPVAYPESSEGKVLELEPWDETVTDLERLATIRGQIKDLQSEEEYLRTSIQAEMQDAEMITMGGEPLVTWKSYRSTKLDVPTLAETRPDVFARFVTKVPESKLRVAELKKSHAEAKDEAFVKAKTSRSFDKKALEADHPGFTEKYTVVKSSTEFDEAAFRAVHPALADEFTTTTYKDSFDAARFTEAEPDLRAEFTIATDPVRRFEMKGA